MDFQDLPHVNAALNAASAVFLFSGFIFIKKGNVAAHRRCMLGALASSGIFLVFYIIYHYTAKLTRFEGQGAARVVYLTILISHTILAVGMMPLIFLTFRRAFRGELEHHKKIAKITFPIWAYVSVTGVVVYWMLYQMKWTEG